MRSTACICQANDWKPVPGPWSSGQFPASVTDPIDLTDLKVRGSLGPRIGAKTFRVRVSIDKLISHPLYMYTAGSTSATTSSSRSIGMAIHGVAVMIVEADSTIIWYHLDVSNIAFPAIMSPKRHGDWLVRESYLGDKLVTAQ